MQKITPMLWFDNNAEEAVNLYTSVFKDAKLGRMARYGKGGPGPEGAVMTAEFELFGQKFVALNAGPMFKFNEAISFVVNCDTQEEVDYYWTKLGEGGDEKAQMCGWLKDKYGVSWQVVPSAIGKMLSDADKKKVGNVSNALMKMKKLNIAELEKAYNA